jgi:hypothetical protein
VQLVALIQLLPASKTKPNEKLFNNNLNAKFFDQLGAE